MKRWFRPLAYAVILMLAALAVFGGSPADPSVEAAALPAPVAARADAHRPSPTPDAATTPAVAARDDAGFDTELFAAAPRPAPAAEAAVVAPVAAEAPADLKILGWMLSGSMPYVFVELKGENYTLSPSQTAEELYRFDKIGGGFAEFTHLPTGQTRQYAVSDPAVVE